MSTEQQVLDLFDNTGKINLTLLWNLFHKERFRYADKSHKHVLLGKKVCEKYVKGL